MALRLLTRAGAKVMAGKNPISHRPTNVFCRRLHSATAGVTSPPEIRSPKKAEFAYGRAFFAYELCDCVTKWPSIPSIVASHGYQIHVSPPEEFATALAHFALHQYNNKHNVNLKLQRVVGINSEKKERILWHYLLEKSHEGEQCTTRLSHLVPSAKDGHQIVKVYESMHLNRHVDGFLYYITFETLDSEEKIRFIAKLWMDQSANMLQLEHIQLENPLAEVEDGASV